MKHVIYYTEYYDHLGNLLRKEENDAYFNTFPDDKEALDIAAQPPVGCRLLLPKLLSGKLSEGDWRAFAAKKPDYQLKYASQYDVDDGFAIYAIYEQLLDDEEFPEPYMVHVSFGAGNELTLDLCVAPLDYDLGDIHITRWEAVGPDAEDKGISIVAGDNSTQDRQITIYYEDWTVSGRWETMEQVSKDVFKYHCHNSLFPFTVTINIERESESIM